MKNCMNYGRRECSMNPKCSELCPGYKVIRKPKPDIGPPPKKLWLKDRIKVLCRCIADANEHHPEW